MGKKAENSSQKPHVSSAKPATQRYEHHGARSAAGAGQAGSCTNALHPQQHAATGCTSHHPSTPAQTSLHGTRSLSPTNVQPHTTSPTPPRKKALPL